MDGYENDYTKEAHYKLIIFKYLYHKILTM